MKKESLMERTKERRGRWGTSDGMGANERLALLARDASGVGEDCFINRRQYSVSCTSRNNQERRDSDKTEGGAEFEEQESKRGSRTHTWGLDL